VLLWRAASPVVARRLALSLLAVGGLAVVAVVALVPPEATQRSLSIFQTTQEAGDTSRIVLWNEAIHAFSQNLMHTLVGIGTGGYASISSTGALYPHNIVLEVGTELGVLGLLALAAFVISVIVRLLRLLAGGGESAGWAGLLLTLFVFSLVNAQFSGDVPYNDGLFLWAGLASGLVAAARAGSHYQLRQRS
jgi:O-antigen ligase